MNIEQVKVGQQVMCNGFLGFIREICAWSITESSDGQSHGMVVVQLQSGQTCVDAGGVDVAMEWQNT